MKNKRLLIIAALLGLFFLVGRSLTLNTAQVVTSPTPQAVKNVQGASVSTTQTPTATVTPTITPTPPKTPIPTIAPDTTSQPNYYINTDGNKVQSPTYYNTAPAGATARCTDGTYSFSQHRRGTCSHHGGVAQWL